MLRRILVFIVIIGFISMPLIGISQDGPLPDEDEPPCGPPFGDPCIPIDGGLSFLIAAGVAYGGKKAHDIYKKR